MTYEEILHQYELNKNNIQQNDNGDWDYDVAPVNITFSLEGTNFNPDKKTRGLETSTINLLQDVFTQPGWELKNATNGLNWEGLLMVEHHQNVQDTEEVKESGILISKAGYWWYGIDDVGFIVLKKDFLVWVYEFNLKCKFFKDGPISNQNWNQGHAFKIPFDKLAYLMRKYKEHLAQ
jgi:hypothetical protein